MAALTDVAALDGHMATASYVTGAAPTQDDISVFKAIAIPAPAFPNALRWYKHINTFSEYQVTTLPGTFKQLSAPSSSPAPAPASPPAKKEKAPKEEKPKKEKAPKEEKKEEKPKEDPAEKAAKEAAKAKEKLLKTVIKEGGKKGVEIEGASDMGGLDFFCTTIESPDGDVELLELAMTAMNAQPKPDDEERKGCSGHVGKMIFSAGVEQLAIVAYVPKPESNKSADKVDVTAWMEHVCKAVDGVVVKPKADADSPAHGGHVVEAVVKSDPDKGKFALKEKDTAMAAAFAFLRLQGAFPEDDGDSDDEPCFGDDAFDNIDDM